MSSNTAERALKLADLRARFPDADADVIEDALTHSHHNVLTAVNMLIGFGCTPARSHPAPSQSPTPPPAPQSAAPKPLPAAPARASVFNDFKSAYVDRALAQSKGNEAAALEVTRTMRSSARDITFAP
jgi:hypothetical protein